MSVIIRGLSLVIHNELLDIIKLLACTQSVNNLLHSFMIHLENEYFLPSSVKSCALALFVKENNLNHRFHNHSI